jgi:hypothetical protein
MRHIGFSTGALAFGDFRKALKMLEGKSVDAVELSALRKHELPELTHALGTLDLSQYAYLSVHAPSSFTVDEEPQIIEHLKHFTRNGWPIVLHPDAIHQIDLWREFGELLYIENMDRRKPIGRTVSELETVFSKLPDALMCFDVAHARQVDSSMTEAFAILKTFRNRLRQLHISEVNTSSKHDRISRGAFRAFREIAHLIPPTIPIILETPVAEFEIEDELRRAESSLRVEEVAVAWSPGHFAIQR